MPRKSRIKEIRISFIAPSGEKTGELVLPVDIAKRQLNTKTWGEEEAIRRFAWYVARCDKKGIDAAYEVLKRLGCLSEALEACAKGRRPNIQKLMALLSLWNTWGLWSIPRALGDNLAQFTDLIRHFAPAYRGAQLKLYRGQSLARYEGGIFGIAWSGRVPIAEQFAGLRDAPGVVLELDASPEMIVTRMGDFISTRKTDPASGSEYEDEYLVDPRAI